MAGPYSTPEMRDAIVASAGRLGIDPSDLGTVISYETGGTFDPWKAGPTTQWGQHRGLLQWGEPQQKKYGVTPDMSVTDQLKAAERYLTDAGVKPGHGLLDIYSAINAGKVGLYNRSDANNGGAPGTVADKVATMAGHRLKANALLGLNGTAAPSSPSVAAPAAAAAVPTDLPMSLAPSGDADMSAALAGLMAIPQAAESETPQAELPAIRYAAPAGLQKARALARLMHNTRMG